jgi:hypothetical protein
MVPTYSLESLYSADIKPVTRFGNYRYQNPGTSIFDPPGPLSETVSSRKFTFDGLGAARGQRLRKGPCAS